MSPRIFLIAALVLAPLTAFAAGPFDGQWTGAAPTQGKVCHTTDIVLTVNGKSASGTATTSVGKFNISGQIDDQGNFAGRLGNEPFTGKFDGNGFAGVYLTPYQMCPKRDVRLQRGK